MHLTTHRSTKRLVTTLLLLFLIGGPTVGPIYGQLAVADLGGLVQTTITAFNTAELVIHTLSQIENQVFMIENQVTNLATLDVSNIGALTGLFGNVLTVLSQADGITYSLGTIDNQFRDLYPELGLPASGGSQFIEALRAWNQQSRRAVQDAMRSQSVTEAIETDSVLIMDAVARSDTSTGNLSALQAGNQIDGLMAAQMVRMQEILAAVHRDQASKRAMETAINDAAIANAAYMMEGFGEATEVTPNAMPDLRY